MKSIIATLFAVALCAAAFAGTLTDHANVFGPRGPELAAYLESKPVYFLTAVKAEGIDAKTVADNWVGTLPSGSFAVFITTQPRAWRISMNPVGLASSEAVRLAGDRMTAEFKQGRFVEGAENLADALIALTAGGVELRRDAAKARIAAEEARLAAFRQKEAEDAQFWWWMGGVTVALVSAFAVVAWLVHRHEKKKDRERKQRFQAQHAPIDPVQIRREREFYSRGSTPSPIGYGPSGPVVHNHYHDHPSQSSGPGFTDGLIIGNMLSQPSHSEPPRYSAPSRSDDDDDSRRRSSSSSDFSFGGSDSSSSSSSDSGSSSDSSGASSGDGDSW